MKAPQDAYRPPCLDELRRAPLLGNPQIGISRKRAKPLRLNSVKKCSLGFWGSGVLLIEGKKVRLPFFNRFSHPCPSTRRSTFNTRAQEHPCEKKGPMTKTIKAILNYRRMTAEVLLPTSSDICAKITNNPNFAPPKAPAPPIDPAALQAANDVLAAAISDSLDGSKIARAQKNDAKEVVVKLLVQLAHYVEANCHGDMTIFLSSGFTPVSSSKTVATPVSDSIRRIDPGPNSGQVAITPVGNADAYSYEVQYAPVSSDGVVGAWKSQPIATTRPATVISGLIPATTYAFQIRGLTRAGFTDWSDSVVRIVI